MAGKREKGSDDRALGEQASTGRRLRLGASVARYLGADFPDLVAAAAAILAGAGRVHDFLRVAVAHHRLSDELSFVHSIATTDDHATLLLCAPS